MQAARAAVAPESPSAAPRAVAIKREELVAASTGSLIRTASEQLDQFDRVMEKLRANMAPGTVTYGRTSSVGQTGQIVDRLG
jgi:hypothetical protein